MLLISTTETQVHSVFLEGRKNFKEIQNDITLLAPKEIASPEFACNLFIPATKETTGKHHQ